ncbi:RNA-directed DNA polymerase -like protein [Trichinella patagoniensis]|uniref:RNA-directed DNA polymerase-like protein n=1 Tax=Trichinella patagoniensis TaxID=990121 RepID=A0A0V1AAH2_9BILA|nr:RNA-directed DNA polymerase -like protein [Trichinella patagoniensis]
MECFECGGLGHFRRGYPHLRARTQSARALSSGTRHHRLLAMTEIQAEQSLSVTGKYRSQYGASPPMGAAQDSIIIGEGRKVPHCGQGVWSLQIGNWRGRIHVAVVESLVVPGILGTNFFNQFFKVIDWQARELTMTDSSRVRIVCKPVQAARPSIECAWITPGPWEVPLEETVREGPETNNGDLEEWGRSLVDRAQCSPWGKRALSGVLRRCGKAISRGETDLGRKNLVQHHIETAGARPVKQSPRRLPQSQRAVMYQLIHEMLRSRRDGSHRFCVDYHKLNAVTRINAQPIPRIDDTLDALAGAQWFSTLDLAFGYWQFRVMPFGLCNALPMFQRLMESALRGMTSKTCLVYLDNIIVLAREVPAYAPERAIPQPYCNAAWNWHGPREDGGSHPETEDPGDPGRHPQPPIRGPPGCDEDAAKGTSAILLASATGRRRGLVQGMPDVRCTVPMYLHPAGYSIQRVGMDIVGPLEETQRGNRYILVVCDYFSKRPKAFALPNAEAPTVATALVNGIFCRYGVPETLYSDQGRNFESELVKEVCQLFGVAKTQATAYRPQSDGLVERMNHTLEFRPFGEGIHRSPR